MGSQERIANQLPLLYRPDEGDDSLFSSLLASAGGVLDDVTESAEDVLRSHWFRQADRAAFEKFFLVAREERSLAPQRPGDVMALRDGRAVADRLDQPEDELGKHLRSGLSSVTRGLLGSRNPDLPPTFALQRAVLDDLKRICQGPLLFTPERFAGVKLSPGLVERLAVESVVEERTRLNARLLVEAYPSELALPGEDSPYVRDLGRLASSLALPPWREPADLAETVEDYRLRLARIVALYRLGIGTTDAIERMIEAQLPPDRAAAEMEREREFWLEELSPLGPSGGAPPPVGKGGLNRLRGVSFAGLVQARGEPLGLLGPLMSFSLQNLGLNPAAPTFYLRGVEPVADQVGATESPMIELYSDARGRMRTGLGYRDTLAPGVTLRLRPAFTSWLAVDGGIARAVSNPTEEDAADPTAPGPWKVVENGPAGVVTALARARDNTLWAGATDGADHTLWRFDGVKWSSAAVMPGTVNALVADGDQLLVATDAGLLSVGLFPPDGVFTSAPVPGVGDRSVLAVLRAGPTKLWIGTDEGAFVLQGAELKPTLATGVEVNDFFADRGGSLLLATSLGVFMHRPMLDQWFILKSGGRADQDADWAVVPPGVMDNSAAMPGDDEVFIPPARRVFRQADGTIWVGSERGLARYVARRTSESGPLAYQTVLEAFPDLVPTVVHEIVEDERGLMWFAMDRGVLRFDGRQFAQARAPRADGEPDAEGEWVRLGSADVIPNPLPEPRGSWRFDRRASQWQRSTDTRPAWTPFVSDEPRTTDEADVRAIVWADSVSADLGSWDGSVFEASDTAADPAKLVSRMKPTETRIAAGGIPALPRVPVGVSLWRYLSMEAGVPAEGPPPAPPIDQELWTTEGRLIPKPPDRAMVVEGRFDLSAGPRGVYDNSVFTYPPAASVWIEWRARRPFTVLARLRRRFDDEVIDPAILDRVWRGMNQVRPAGVKLLLAVEETVVRGLDHG